MGGAVTKAYQKVTKAEEEVPVQKLNLRTHSIGDGGSFRLSSTKMNESVPVSWFDIVEPTIDGGAPEHLMEVKTSLFSSFRQRALCGSDGHFHSLFGSLGEDNNPVVLGSGMEGEVYMIKRRSDGRSFALKTLELDPLSNLSRSNSFELSRLTSFDHPRIVKIHDVFTHKNECTYFLTFEVGMGGDMYRYIKKHKVVDEDTAGVLVRQMLEAVIYLHFMNVIHRDLKLENFVFRTDDEGNPVLLLIDFGLATVCQPGMTKSEKSGTIHYIAPEMHRGLYSFECDMWSLGVIVFMLLTGRRPFLGKTDAEVIRNVLAGNVTFKPEIWDKRSPEALDFVHKLLIVNPEQRMTAMQAMHHPWMRKYRYAAYPYLKQLTLQMIAYDLAFEEVEKFVPLFEFFVGDNPGVVTLPRMRQIFPQDLVDDRELAEIFMALDRDSKAYCTWTEIVAALLVPTDYCKEKHKVSRVFRKLTFAYQQDRIKFEDLKYLLSEVCSDEDIHTIIKEAAIAARPAVIKPGQPMELTWRDFVKMMRTEIIPPRPIDINRESVRKRSDASAKNLATIPRDNSDTPENDSGRSSRQEEHHETKDESPQSDADKQKVDETQAATTTETATTQD